MHEIEARDRDLLNILQTEVPVSSTPFALIGQMIDMSEKEVIKRTERLKREGIVRRIAGQFDARALGYRSCLVAARVAPEQVDGAAAAINLHPGVTQNYLRNHEFNLWFTIALPPDTKLGLERTVERLGEEAQCAVTRLLPTLKLLKTSAEGGEHSPNDVAGDGADDDRDSAALSEREIAYVTVLQRDLPMQPRPFDALGSTIGTSGDELVAAARTFLKRQQMRKFAAAVESRKPTFSATTMGVWTVPAERVDPFGAKMADFKAVSHCYLRPVYPDWPYNVFTTVHGRSVDECESVLAEIAEATGVVERSALYPTRELKRVRIAFFSPEVAQWEAAHSSADSASAAG